MSIEAQEGEAYEDVRNINLPWGYWLLDDGTSAHRVIDEDGNCWESVRDCLWRSRLGMPHMNREGQEDALEFLLTVLAVLDSRIMGIEESAIDLFGGEWAISRHYSQWLIGQRLTDDHASSSRLSGFLTAEGTAILIMLASTRSAKHAPIPIGLRWIEQRRGLDRGERREALDDLLGRQERFADHLPYRFVRRDVDGTPMITLLGDGLGPTIPLRRTLWSLSFADEYGRDRFYLWLHERIDRWEPWGTMAYLRGSRTLSEHLLQLQLADQPIAIV